MQVMNTILTVIGALLTVLWGVAHLFPTKNVVKGFGDISKDNKHIITMEWINEGATLIFLGSLVIISLIVTGAPVQYINISVSVMLLVLSLISLFTGFKVKFLPFKLCPIIFTASAICLVIGGIT
jgi:hypothetical protein